MWGNGNTTGVGRERGSKAVHPRARTHPKQELRSLISACLHVCAHSCLHVQKRACPHMRLCGFGLSPRRPSHKTCSMLGLLSVRGCRWRQRSCQTCRNGTTSPWCPTSSCCRWLPPPPLPLASGLVLCARGCTCMLILLVCQGAGWVAAKLQSEIKHPQIQTPAPAPAPTRSPTFLTSHNHAHNSPHPFSANRTHTGHTKSANPPQNSCYTLT